MRLTVRLLALMMHSTMAAVVTTAVATAAATTMATAVATAVVFVSFLGIGNAQANATAAVTPAAYSPNKNKVLRYAFEISETGMDPHRVSDVYSTMAHNAIFDSPLHYDYLARPLKVKANTLTALPDISSDFKTFTFHVKPGIYFERPR